MPSSPLDPSALLDLFRNRRSYKPAMLSPEPVARELIDQVLEAARWAPSHGQTQPWRFTIFAGDARKALGETFAETFRQLSEPTGKFTQAAFDSWRDRPFTAPVWIALGMQPGLKPDGSRAMPEEEELMAVACAVQNLHLMAAGLGLGGQWTSNAIATSPLLNPLLGLTSPGGRPLGFFFLGHPKPDAAPTSTRAPAETRIRWAE